MRLHFVVLIIGALIPSAHAADLELKPASSLNCEDVLANVKEALTATLSTFVLGYPVGMHIGMFNDLRKLVLASGMDRATAIQAIALVDRHLKAHKNKDTVIGSVSKYLDKFQREQRSLLICVLEGSCHMTVGTMFVPDESRISLRTKSGLRARLNDNIPHLILMHGGPYPYAWDGIPGPNQAVALAWAIDFFTAATSFASYELITDWIEANTRLLQARERSDELFDRYARIIPRTQVTVGFYRAISSSRASTTILTIAPHEEQPMREQAMAEIKSVGTETEGVVRDFNLTTENIIEFGERVTREMAATIRRASKL